MYRYGSSLAPPGQTARPPRRRLGDASRWLAAAGKQLVALNLGTSPAGQRATVRHTAHDAGDSSAYSVLLAEHDVIECSSVDALIDTAHVLARIRPMAGDRVRIVTSSGGRRHACGPLRPCGPACP